MNSSRHSIPTPADSGSCPVSIAASQEHEARADWHYVGFWSRVLGTGADTLMIAAIVTPVLMIIYGPGYLFDDQLVQGTWHVIIGAILPAAAALWFLFRFQATPGKMMIHSHIVDQDTGRKPRPWQLIVRYLSFSLISLPLLGLGCLWVAIDTRNQGWHDKLARTIVIKRLEWEHKVGD